jgi:hypothetical protein
MRGESDRECRASGGALKKQARKNVEREARGAHPKNTPDGTLSRGGGPIFKAEGGAVDRADGGSIDRADGGLIARLKGGRVKKQLGGAAIGGAGKKPSMGRAGRARGGGVGADLHPKTHDAGSGPKQRKIMSKSEVVPPGS